MTGATNGALVCGMTPPPMVWARIASIAGSALQNNSRRCTLGLAELSEQLAGVAAVQDLASTACAMPTRNALRAGRDAQRSGSGA